MLNIVERSRGGCKNGRAGGQDTRISGGQDAGGVAYLYGAIGTCQYAVMILMHMQNGIVTVEYSIRIRGVFS